MITPNQTNFFISTFIFILGISFLLERAGLIKQLYNDWKKKRHGRTLSQQWTESDKDRKGGEVIPRNQVGDEKIASHPPFFSLLSYYLLF